MPTCTSCGRWDAPRPGVTVCSICGGVLGHSDAWQRDAVEAAGEGLTVEELRSRRDSAARARWEELAAAREGEAAAREGEAVALREATRNGLIAAGLPGKVADEWLAAWQRFTNKEHVVPVEPWTAAYWDAGRTWIAEGRAVRPRPAQFDHQPPDGQGMGLAWIMFSIPATVVAGAILLVAFLLLGEPLWIPVVATVVGLFGGSVLMFVLEGGTWWIVDRLAYRLAWVDRHGETIYWVFGVVLGLAMLPITAVVTAMLLAAVI